MGTVFTVGQVNSYIKNLFTNDYALNNIYIKGEVSNCKYHSQGHIYFTMKDSKSSLSCVMFASARKALTFLLKDGQSIIVKGSLSVYERDGKYQLYANQITLDGQGALYERFEILKKKLMEEGVFDRSHKKKIPVYAKRIGIVTAKTGSVIQDIMNISARRNPYVQLILYPALVQGEEASYSIVKGIKTLDDMDVDCIIIGRGGGSIEDLWAFNTEEVARAIYNAKTPIISAVGHETDTTIADYAADLRAPTPSAAAELSVYDYMQAQNRFSEIQLTMNKIIKHLIYIQNIKMDKYSIKLQHLNPISQIRQKRQYLIELEDTLYRTMERKLQTKKHKLALMSERLNGLSPVKKLSQGYAMITDEKDQVIRSVKQVECDDEISVHLIDGKVITKVIRTFKGER